MATFSYRQIETIATEAEKLRAWAKSTNRDCAASMHDDVRWAAIRQLDHLDGQPEFADDCEDELWDTIEPVWADYSYAVARAAESTVPAVSL